MTDDLLAAFRSDVPLPSAARAAQTYSRATSGRRTLLRRQLALAVALAAAVAAGVSFAVVTTGGSAPHYRTSKPAHLNPNGIGPIDWSHPGGRDGHSVGSVAGAANDLAFQPVVPSDLGTPAAIVVDPEGAGDASLTVAYGLPESGAVYWLMERPSRATTTETLASIAKECTPKAGCEGDASIVQLDAGNEGLLVVGPPGTSVGVVWVADGIYFDVLGPPRSFTAKRAESVANLVIAASGAADG